MHVILLSAGSLVHKVGKRMMDYAQALHGLAL